MIRSFSNIPIRQKLTFISMVTSGAALLLASAGFLIYEQVAFKRSLLSDLASTAEMIGLNSAAALSFDDAGSATQTLASLAVQPHITAACLYDRDGVRFATYRRAGAPPVAFGPAPARAQEQFGTDHLELSRPIVLRRESIGTIVLHSDLQALRERLQSYALIVGLVMLVSMAITYVITARLRRAIAEPVSGLAAIAGRVAAESNYALRAVKHGDDELGRFIDVFNGMLTQIQARDAELQAAHAHLEKRVEQRTDALKQAQEATAQEQARFRLIFEGVPVGISYFAGQTESQPEVSLINDAHLRICGLTREQAQDPTIFKRISHPEDSQRQWPLDRQLDRGEIDRFSIEKRYLRLDGQTVWAVFTTQRKQFADGNYERLSTVVDITALKRAQEEAARQEAQLRFIFEAIPFSVTWVRYNDGKNETLFNSAFYRITGFSREKPPEVGEVRALTHPEDLKRQDELRRKLDRGEIDQFAMEKRYVRANGATVWVLLTINAYRGTDGRILQEVSTLVDITERKQAEMELEQMHRQLIDTSRQAGMAEVATGVLHNVGNVLNSVNVSATLVTEQVRRSKAPNLGKVCVLLDEHAADLGGYLTADPKGRVIPGYLATLAESLAGENHTLLTELEHLRKNIEHIKDIVAMQQSYAKTSGVTETISVPDLVEDALRMNAGSLARHDIDIVREYHARPVITLDKHKVLQILINLVRNAKYACDEAGRIDKVITVRITADDRNVSITIADNGVGIAPENLTRIFAHGFTTREHGHGFGLHSGALAAKELGGALVPYSAGPGQGASFTLKLPYAKESPPHEQSPAR